jgi:hypothetical protein
MQKKLQILGSAIFYRKQQRANSNLNIYYQTYLYCYLSSVASTYFSCYILKHIQIKTSNTRSLQRSQRAQRSQDPRLQARLYKLNYTQVQTHEYEYEYTREHMHKYTHKQIF